MTELGSSSAASSRSETVDRYLETIYYIEHEGEVVRPGRLAEWLGVSPPTVSVTLQRLSRDGWVAVEPDRSVRLTDAGNEAASAIVRRHRILERWLTDVLGLDWGAADTEAGELAHGMSERVMERLDEHLGKPSTCPHGNHIPGRAESSRPVIALGDLPIGSPGEVIRISEVAEHEAPELLSTLHNGGLVPGASVCVVVREGDRLYVNVGAHSAELPAGTARAVWVAPAPAD